MRARAAAAAIASALAVAGAACATRSTDDCPGVPLVTLALHGTLDATGTGCTVAPAGGWVVPASIPEVAPTASDPVPTFQASFQQEPGSDRIAYCTGDRAAVLQGTRSGDHLRAEASLRGAVLGACAATCRPVTTEVIEGDLVPGQGGAAGTFSGTLTETFDAGEGPCGDCVLPCTSRYVVVGTAE